MRVRVKAIGSGQTGDPVRVLLPTWSFVAYDPVTNMMTVDIPDDDAPDSPPPEGSAGRPITPYGPVLARLPPQAQAAWHMRLDQRYAEHKGRFRPVTE